MKTENAVTRATTRGLKPKQLTIGKSELSVRSMLFGISYALLAMALLFSSEHRALAQSNECHGVTNVVLVHGAWADGSSWSKVIPLLQAEGLHVTAVQLPLTSLADDTATVKRAIALQDGPFLLVGHSYGGSVITEAGNDPKVAGLIYVAAFAPDNEQSTLDQIKANPTPIGTELRPDASGFIKLSDKGAFEDLAADLTETEKKILDATQGPTAGAAFGASISSPAWRNKPTWFVIASQDRVISPKLEEAEAQEMKAKSITLPSGHLVMLSHPVQVANFIERAASQASTD